MRIIAGDKRGTQILAPKGMDTRPTLDRVKESLFGILQFDIAGSRVLDLFAGSGNLGLEALSRHAAFAVFCDHSRESVRVINANIQKLGFGDRARVYACEWDRAISEMCAAGAGFDIVFLDPPYASGLITQAASMLYERGLLNDGFVIAAEHASDVALQLPDAFEATGTRRYGEAAISFLKEKKQ